MHQVPQQNFCGRQILRHLYDLLYQFRTLTSTCPQASACTLEFSRFSSSNRDHGHHSRFSIRNRNNGVHHDCSSQHAALTSAYSQVAIRITCVKLISSSSKQHLPHYELRQQYLPWTSQQIIMVDLSQTSCSFSMTIQTMTVKVVPSDSMDQ